MALTFKVLSALLAYPTAELQESADALRATLDMEAIIPPALRNHLDKLINEVAACDLYDLQERYTLLFDRTRSLSLYLFEHVHGESRDRGQAMIDLGAMYERHGLARISSELPDYIPLFLEFLATVPQREAYDLLSQPAHILAAIAERLRKRQSRYESVFRALVALAASKPQGNDIEVLLSLPDPDANDLAALDAAWEDEAVTFGPGAGDSCKDSLVARVRAARRPAAHQS
jgi:nitrate reductase molybdenum cofactor assembly chaperone NarJ/NarW